MLKMRRFLERWIGSDGVENYALLAVLLASLIASVGFWFGRPCSGWYFWCGFSVSLVLISFCGLKRCVGLVALLGICWLLAAWTFPYVGIDYKVYHAPMQRLLINGWNPVFQGLMEDVSSLTDNGCSIYRTLFFAHGCELICALVAKATGLFLADAFFSYLAAFVVFSSASRFAVREWKIAGYATFLFAVVAAFPFVFFVTFIGAIDYPLYAMLASAFFATLNYERDHQRRDLFTALVCLALGLVFKANGAYLCVLGFGYLAIRHFRRFEVRVGVLTAVLAACLLGATPYLTAWIHYGSPFYPLHTFNPNVQLFDINHDFTQNADADQMGYLARIVYAWFSKTLAIWGCALLSGKSDFNPYFGVPGGVAGMKELFKIFMWCAVIALALAKKTRVTLAALVVFGLSNLAPLRYIGYGRYFAFIWLVPLLAAYNLMNNPLPLAQPLMRWGRYVVLVAYSGLSVSIFAKATAHYVRQAAFEGLRQEALDGAQKDGVVFTAWDECCRYTLHERLYHVKGVDYDPSSNAVKVAFSDTYLMPGITPEREKWLDDMFPVCYKLKDYGRFEWRAALKHWPHILMER